MGHHGRTGSLMLMTSQGVKRGIGFRRMPNADRWDPTGWDQLRGIPWELSAPRPVAGERLIGEDRLVVPPPPPEARVAPPQRRKLYIRREDVHKHGASEGCPGCTCVLENRGTTVPQLVGQESLRQWRKTRLEQRESRRMQRSAKKTKRERDRPKPVVVSTEERDISVEDAEGRPVEPSGVEHPPPEIPEDPDERAKLKRQVMPTPEAKVKPKVSPRQVKRPGSLSIASGPPLRRSHRRHKV